MRTIWLALYFKGVEGFKMCVLWLRLELGLGLFGMVGVRVWGMHYVYEKDVCARVCVILTAPKVGARCLFFVCAFPHKPSICCKRSPVSQLSAENGPNPVCLEMIEIHYIILYTLYSTYVHLTSCWSRFPPFFP